MVNYLVSVYSDLKGHTLCTFELVESNKIQLISHIEVKLDGIPELLDRLEKTVSIDSNFTVATNRMGTLALAIRDKWSKASVRVRDLAAKHLEDLGDGFSSKRVAVVRHLQEDVNDDLQTATEENCSRLLKAISLGLSAVKNPVYASTFAGEPRNPTERSGWM
jgi:hypothetical protein